MAIALSLLKHTVPEFRGFPLLPITVLYGLLLTLLIGSLASAEKRQFGTLEWQMLLPMAAWRQWVVKMCVIAAVAFALTIGLPIVLSFIAPSGEDLHTARRAWRESALMAVVFMASGLYASSLTTGGVRALVWSIPFGAGALFTIQSANSAAWWILHSQGVFVRAGLATFSYVNSVVLAGGLVALMVGFAFGNHRSAERSLTRVWRQAGWMVAFLAAATVVFAAALVATRVR